MDVSQLFGMLDKIEKTEENEGLVEEIRTAIEEGDYKLAMDKINELNGVGVAIKEDEENDHEEEKSKPKEEETDKYDYYDDDENEDEVKYPDKLKNIKLEETFIGMLLNNPKAISMYYILFDECYFESKELLDVYKEILFTEGQAFAPEKAKRGYNFAQETPELIEYREDLREKYSNKNYNFEKIYVELKKLFVLRKEYLGMPIATTQEKIVEIVDYNLYDKMSEEEVKAAVEQVTVTQKFKSSVLTEGVSKFLAKGDNTLTTGLQIPFKILTGKQCLLQCLQIQVKVCLQ